MTLKDEMTLIRSLLEQILLKQAEISARIGKIEVQCAFTTNLIKRREKL